MFLYNSVIEASKLDRPVKVGLVGAGKFGAMFLSQVPTTVGIRVDCIADLQPENAKLTCINVGWSTELIKETSFFEDPIEMMKSSELDVIVEATGDPVMGLMHASTAIKNDMHVVMVNVEADALAGTELALLAEKAGVVYSLAYGDQPALTCEMVDWARSTGFEVVSAGKGTKYLPVYHNSTPADVWQHYGLTAEQARTAGMNSKMFNSFLDGTKSAIEMAALSNATGLSPPTDGLKFPPAGVDDLANILKPRAEGGMLETSGQVEVVSSLKRDGTPVFKDLRWGVFVVIKAPNKYSSACFKQYGMNTDKSGQYSAMYKPFHLIGLELNISIFSAALLQKPTGAPCNFVADVVAVAKGNLRKGQILDGEGGYTVWGKLIPAQKSLSCDCLPIGLANNVVLKNDVSASSFIRFEDVEISGAHNHQALLMRKKVENQTEFNET
ncbi:MAG: flagellar biosynthesis protein FlgA [Pseudomonadota bacterium]|nr:flagellar biosynthesis protein FlgA [Pseudomonadota bacterium]